MIVLKSVFVLVIVLQLTLCEDCTNASVASVPEEEHCVEEAVQEEKETDISKQETENVYLNSEHVAESSSKAPIVEEVIEDSEIQDDSRTTVQYKGENYVTSSPHSRREGESVYEETSSEKGEVLVSDHKEEGGAVTDQRGNEDDSETNLAESKTDPSDESLLTISYDDVDIKNGNANPSTKSHPDETDDNKEDLSSLNLQTGDPVTEPLLISASKEEALALADSNIRGTNPQKLTMEETVGDDWKNEFSKTSNLNQAMESKFNKTFQNYQRYHVAGEPQALRLTTDEINESESRVKENESMLRDERLRKNVGSLPSGNENIETPPTTDTTSTHYWTTGQSETEGSTPSQTNYLREIKRTSSGFQYDLQNQNYTFKPIPRTEEQPAKNNEKPSITVPNDEPAPEQLPVAERLYSYNDEDDYKNHHSNRLDYNPEHKAYESNSQSQHEYEYGNERDSRTDYLGGYPYYKQDKDDQKVDDCPDCDFRTLPVRSSDQRIDHEDEEEETLPTSQIRFAELPETRDLQVNKLGLSEGLFLFSYLGDFLSLIQPNEFPVDLLRSALTNQITWVGLITESLQVEAGFVCCLVAGVLLAFAVPVVVLSHACYRMGGRDDDQAEDAGCAGNCRRRTLVFILQILLILLLAGMVAMFVTNEQLSSSVVQSSEVLQSSLSDLSGYVHDSHLQLHFLVTQSIDQTLQAIYADLDNVDSLLGRPIQKELVRETGLDVALDTLADLSREAKMTTQQVEKFLDETRIVQEMLTSSRDKISELRQQVELFRRACDVRDRLLCDSIDASGLDVTLRVDKIKNDERLNRMRRMGGIAFEAAASKAKEQFMQIPTRVEMDTRDAREDVRRQCSRQRAQVDESSRELEEFAREVSTKVNEAKYQAGFWMQDSDQYEYWRWIVCMGGGAAVLLIWTMLFCSLCCGCCGSEKAAGPTILLTIVVLCLFSTALWSLALVGLLVGGHGEVFVCRPLYDEPDFHVITHLVDEPGVFYNDPRGGFIANVVYGNNSIDVPIKQVLQDCHDNRAIYPTLGLHRVFDVDGAVDQHRWASVSMHLRAVRANLSTLEVMGPGLQDQLSDLLAAISVNFTEHRIQMSRPVVGKDMDSFARQLDNIGNQLRDLATASRIETLSTRTRRLIDSHIRPLESRKDALVYQLTALEVQTGPLQRQINQSLSHLRTIQYFINNQGEAIAHRKSREYVDRLLSYVEQLRHHVTDSARSSVAPCRPLWDIFNNARLFLCRHTMDPLNGFWFATMWCMVVLLIATPVCLKLVDYYRVQGSRPSGSPTENLVISEQGAGWSSPGYDIKCSKEYSS